MDISIIEKIISEYSGIRITEKELRQLVPVTDYQDYYELMMNLINSGTLAPVKSSGSNGMSPPLHKRYGIRRPKQSFDQWIPEIRMLANPLNIDGYLADPEKYQQHREWLCFLDSFLKKNRTSLEIPLSVNERSFQIFGREKALKSDRELAAVLRFNPGLWETLNCYDTPEPFFTCNITQWDGEPGQDSQPGESGRTGQSARHLNILIIENKDTWYTLCNRLKSGNCTLSGILFDCLIYGEGKKISRKIDSLTEFGHSFFKRAQTSYYYFGDLDYEGIGIAHELVLTNPTLMVKLMRPLYISMLDASKGIELPPTKEKQIINADAVEWFTSQFEPGYRSAIEQILLDGRYIPQEILHNARFLEMTGKEI